MDEAARSLGATPSETLRRVHLPILRSSLFTAGLLVFVDVMKELPATLVMRPFNFDTLATQAYTLASDEWLAEASSASLAIVAVGLLPSYHAIVHVYGKAGVERPATGAMDRRRAFELLPDPAPYLMRLAVGGAIKNDLGFGAIHGRTDRQRVRLEFSKRFQGRIADF